jgi:predicted RNA-binding protein YlqC (UPF0109 family)
MGSLSAVRPTCHFVRMPRCPNLQPSGRRFKSSDSHQTKASSVRTTWIPVRTFPCVEKLRTAPACIGPDVSAAYPEDSQSLTKLQIFFPKSDMGRLLQLSGRSGYSLRQVLQFKSRRPDASQHGPDARSSNMEIACIRSAVQTTISLVQTHEAFIRKLLAADVRLSERQCLIVRTWLSNRKDLQRNF